MGLCLPGVFAAWVAVFAGFSGSLSGTMTPETIPAIALGLGFLPASGGARRQYFRFDPVSSQAGRAGWAVFLRDRPAGLESAVIFRGETEPFKLHQ